MKKIFFGLCLLLSSSAFVNAQNASNIKPKRFHELGISYNPSNPASVYAPTYKRELTSTTYAFCRLDMTRLAFYASNYDTTQNSKSTFFGGTIGLEFRHNKKNKSMPDSEKDNRIVDLDNFFFVHGPEISWGTGSERLTPNAVKTGQKTVGAGYSVGIMTYINFIRPKALAIGVQYIPGVYSVKHYNNEVFSTKETVWRYNHKALFVTMTYRFKTKDKKVK